MRIFVTNQFDALHHWKDAPKEQAFLRNPHRHMFKVRTDIDVKHDDRELEFFEIQYLIEQIIEKCVDISDAGSCEMIATLILKELWKVSKLRGRSMSCRVSEDGENGAIVYMTPEGAIE